MSSADDRKSASKVSRDEMMGYGRFGYTPGKFKGCRFCRGAGCPACDEQAKQQFPAFKEREDAEYQRLFPNGPTPLAAFKTDSAKDMAECKRVFGADSLREAFGPGGGGVASLIEKLKHGETNE